MIAPIRHSKSFDISKGGDTRMYIHYAVFGGEFQGAEIHTPIINDFIFVPADQFSDLQKATFKEEIQKYLGLKKDTYNSDGPDAA